MSGFHTATICADCVPPVVAVSTGYGSRCTRCDQIDESRDLSWKFLDDSQLAHKVLGDTMFRSDGDACLLDELARRLLKHDKDFT